MNQWFLGQLDNHWKTNNNEANGVCAKESEREMKKKMYARESVYMCVYGNGTEQEKGRPRAPCPLIITHQPEPSFHALEYT